MSHESVEIWYAPDAAPARAGKPFLTLNSPKPPLWRTIKEQRTRFKFNLDGFSYDEFFGGSPKNANHRIEWLASRSDVLPFSPLPYEQAAKILFEMGHGNEARQILLEKEKQADLDADKNKKWQHWWQRPLRWLWGKLAGYGYRPACTFMHAMIIVGIGWGVFWLADIQGHIGPHQATILTNEGYRDALTVRAGIMPTDVMREKFPGISGI